MYFKIAKPLDEQTSVSLNLLPRIEEVPKLPKPTGEPLHEITIDSKYLKALANAADGFGPVRIRFYGADKPVSFNAVIPETGQKWEALLMPRYAHVDDERFKLCEDEGCPQYPTEHVCVSRVETEIERAMRLAKDMMG